MDRTRRKKLLLLVLFILMLLLAIGFLFRHRLILSFQYSQLNGLECHSGEGGKCLDRIWVHRVNSVGRYEFLAAKFAGFETDIVYDQSLGSYSVYHPPLTPGDKDTLSLATFLKAVDLSRSRLWLDTRFVGESNMWDALEAMRQLDPTGMLRKTAIVELYDPAAARFFSEHGYTVSLNISPELQAQMNTHSFRDSIVNIVSVVKYVSREAEQVPALKKLFPDKQIITWDQRFSNFFDTSALQKLLDDERIAVILVNIKSRYYR